MHKPVAAPFQGSTVTDGATDTAPFRMLDLSFSFLSVLAAASAWMAAAHQSPTAGVISAPVWANLTLLASALASLWLLHEAEGAWRNAVVQIYASVFQRLDQAGPQAVHPPAQASYNGIAGLIGDLVLLIRRLQAGRERERQHTAALSRAMQKSRAQAQQVAADIQQDAGCLAETAAEIGLTNERIERATANTIQSVAIAEAGMERATAELAALAGSVRTVAVGAEQMTSVAVDLSRLTRTTQHGVTSSQEKTVEIKTVLDSIEQALQTAVALGQSASVEAASLPDSQNLSAIAHELQAVSGTCRLALASLGPLVSELVAQSAEANRRTIEIGNLVLANRQAGEAIASAAQQQGEEITAALHHIYEAREGFTALKASVDQVTARNFSHEKSAEALRLTAQRLPDRVKGFASLLRGLPDVAPSGH